MLVIVIGTFSSLGFRHPVQSTVVRTTRVLSTLLSIVAKSESHDKFKVTSTSVPYLAALVSVVEEVRTRCPVKHRSVLISSSSSSSSSSSTPAPAHPSLSPIPQSHSSTSIADFANAAVAAAVSSNSVLTNPALNSNFLSIQQSVYNRRQKLWEPSYLDKTRKTGAVYGMSGTRLLSVPTHARHWHSFDIEHAVPRILSKPASTLVQLQQTKQVVPTIAVTPQTVPETQTGSQVQLMTPFSVHSTH